jgi:hypothetical protein
MFKGKYVVLSLVAALVCWQAMGIDAVNSGIVDPCLSTVTIANPGTVVPVTVCPLGDGDPFKYTGPPNPPADYDHTITLTVKDGTGTGIGGIPTVDMWLVGCNDGLLLCGGSSGSNPDVVTSIAGVTTFTQEPQAGGCDTGLYVVVQGVVIQDPATCLPLCLPIEVRSPDYKSAGAPGPPGCILDLKCPDSKVSSADFSWFTTHFTVGGGPVKPYHACADYAAPFGVNGLSDLSKFTIHFAGAGHKCPI